VKRFILQSSPSFCYVRPLGLKTSYTHTHARARARVCIYETYFYIYFRTLVKVLQKFCLRFLCLKKRLNVYRAYISVQNC
jgi:hypothetical protein